MTTGDKPHRINGFTVTGLRGVIALIVSAVTLLSLFVGILQWGLKLEHQFLAERQANRLEILRLESRVAILEQKVGNGILPRAEERIESLDERLAEHKQNHD
jgi:hypothetical protein